VKLAGRTAIVTGAGDGIGRGIALALAREGADVGLCDINARALEECRSGVESLGRKACARTMDVRDAGSVRAMVDDVAAAFGGIDILINNAAIMPVGPLEEQDEDTLDRCLAVNLKAPILFSRFVTPHMRRRGRGSIIHMASVTGHNGHAGVVVYGCTKGALIALAKGQAIELAPANIRVNTVSPGAVDSPMLHRFLTEHASDPLSARRAFDALHPRGRVATIEEVAAVFVFLASDDAANITGTDIRCDGGYAIQGQQPRT